jgi:hypothetical protein
VVAVAVQAIQIQLEAQAVVVTERLAQGVCHQLN